MTMPAILFLIPAPPTTLWQNKPQIARPLAHGRPAHPAVNSSARHPPPLHLVAATGVPHIGDLDRIRAPQTLAIRSLKLYECLAAGRYGEQEVDRSEERDGKLLGYQCKWSTKRGSPLREAGSTPIPKLSSRPSRRGTIWILCCNRHTRKYDSAPDRLL